MKNLFLTSLLIVLISCSHKTEEYYTTNGKNRLSKAELDNYLLEKKQKFDEIMGEEMSVSSKIQKTEKKKDSIIHWVSIDVKNLEITESNGPLSHYLDKPLPKMALTDINGKEFTFDQLKGKPTLINFWFTTCHPCIDEMPVLNKIYDQYKDDYNFVAITYEPKEKAEEFLKTHPYKFLHITDAKAFTTKLGLMAYPVNLFLDKNGIVRFSEYGIPYESNNDEEAKMGDGKNFIEHLEELK